MRENKGYEHWYKLVDTFIILSILTVVWRVLEIKLYGEVRPDTVDSIIILILCPIVYLAVGQLREIGYNMQNPTKGVIHMEISLIEKTGGSRIKVSVKEYNNDYRLRAFLSNFKLVRESSRYKYYETDIDLLNNRR